VTDGQTDGQTPGDGNSRAMHSIARQKRRLGPKLAGIWARGASEKNLGPLLISAIVEASNFKFGTQPGFGTSLPKTTYRTKFGGGLGHGSIEKNFGPPYLFPVD